MRKEDFTKISGSDERGDYIQTFTGIKFYPKDIQMDDISIIDITESLSKQCRYNGHCQGFYSVAEHSAILANHVLATLGDPDLAREILLHDASEAYICDIPRPYKRLLPQYVELEELIQSKISEKFELKYPHEEWLKWLDLVITGDEKDQIMLDMDDDWGLLPDRLGIKVEGLHYKDAAKFFWDMATHLGVTHESQPPMVFQL